jgi:SAM-dependent methyltransferase
MTLLCDKDRPMKRSDRLARQGRQPSGWLGHIVGRIMARETHQANLVALDQLDLQPEDRLLEIGFGHGRTLATAAKRITSGRLAGIDPSEVMMKIARGRNARALRSGRMALALGGSDRLPYPSGEFDKVLSVHTIYFWTAPERDLAEVHRVMAPGARLVIGYRPSEDLGFGRDFPATIYNIRSVAQIERLVGEAGFTDIVTLRRPHGAGLMAWTSARSKTSGAAGGASDTLMLAGALASGQIQGPVRQILGR